MVIYGEKLMRYLKTTKNLVLITNAILIFIFISAQIAGDDKIEKQAKPNNEEAAYLPGGEEVKRLVEARRGKTELSKLVSTMEPGTWAVLNVETPKGLWSAPPPSKGLHIGTWSDDAHWDSRTGQFLYFGVRQTRKFVAYSEEKNAWHVIEFDKKPNAPEVPQRFGHQYSCNSFDPERSRFFTYTYLYDVQKDNWGQFPNPPEKVSSKTMTLEYFTAMDGLLMLGRQPTGSLVLYQESKKEWLNLGPIPVHGYHSLARHNPYLKEVLLAGGNDSNTVVILNKEGKIEKKKDFPVALKKFTIRSTILTIDPASGRYLFMVPGQLLVEYDSKKDEYRLVDDFSKTPWPFGRYDSPLVAHIPEYGVSMWADSKTFIYKHKLCTQAPIDETLAKELAKKSEGKE